MGNRSEANKCSERCEITKETSMSFILRSKYGLHIASLCGFPDLLLFKLNTDAHHIHPSS